MSLEELSEILAKHKLWLQGKDGGERANLEGANLEGADLRYADLECTNLRNANLRNANLRYANLNDADLKDADLMFADLKDADIDYSAWPLWCGSLRAHVDDRIAVQLLYHALSVVQYSPYVSEDIKRTLLTPDVVEVANQFHRVDECGKLDVFHGGEEA